MPQREIFVDKLDQIFTDKNNYKNLTLSNGLSGIMVSLSVLGKNKVISDEKINKYSKIINKGLNDLLNENWNYDVGLFTGLSGLSLSIILYSGQPLNILDDILLEKSQKLANSVSSKITYQKKLSLKEYDYYSGLSGVLTYIAMASSITMINPKWTELKYQIVGIFNLIANEITEVPKQFNKCNSLIQEDVWDSDNGSKGYYLGVAHGISGILHSLNNLILFDKDISNNQKVISIIKKLLFFFYDTKIIKGNNFLWLPIYSYEMNNNHTLLSQVNFSWCHGITGVSKVLETSFSLLGLTNYSYKIAKNYIDLCDKYDVLGKVNEPGLCHGYTSIYFTYQNFIDKYNLTLNKEIPHRYIVGSNQSFWNGELGQLLTILYFDKKLNNYKYFEHFIG